MGVRIGIIDSGVSNELFTNVVLSKCFFNDHEVSSAETDEIDHGNQIAELILEGCPDAELLVAKVFHTRGRCPVSRIVTALDWLIAEGAQLVNMSFGMLYQDLSLAAACRRAQASGIVLVASAPAIGGKVYPSGFDSCLAITGDARCAADEISWLGQSHADFGACPMRVPLQPAYGGGSSFACARFTGFIANHLKNLENQTGDLSLFLRLKANYQGPEVRRA